MKRTFLTLTALLLAPLVSLPAAANEAMLAFEELLKIDVHSHVFEDFPALNDLFQRINIRTVNICVPASGKSQPSTPDHVTFTGHFVDDVRASVTIRKAVPNHRNEALP
jgi:hypothetical protein